MPRRLLTLGTCLIGLLFSAALTATEARVAVASNFLPTARQLAANFQRRSGHALRISSASSGKLYAQIHHGAPFDLKRVFDLVKDFGTSESPKSTRSSTTHWCPGRPGHPAFRHNIASSLRLHTGLPYDWTPRSDAPLGSPLAPSARRVSRVASRLPGTAQIHHGAPFDLLLSADARRPERLAIEGLAKPDKVRPYAIGQLVFWMPKQDGDASRCRARLQEGNLRLALANPRTAPYGSAAWETLEALGFDPAQLPLIQGENVAQAFAFVASGSADGGFVAASQLTAGNREGCRWPVPGELHTPIVQKAALLKRGEPNPAARAFFAYLLGPEARQVIRRAGYLLP